MAVNRLHFGDTIGVIAPASPSDFQTIKKQLNLLETLGFKIKCGSHLYDNFGYLAGCDENRAKDLIHMFEDNDVRMIICFRGGYGSMRILPLIDFNIIKKNPKIFIGYSDITTLLNHIALKCNFITFHGPMVNTNFKDIYTLQSFLNTLMKGDRPYAIENPVEGSLIFHGRESVEGILVGGNLTLITATIGTPYEISFENKIVFIEEVSEAPYRIDRMLTQLYLSGKLNSCKGFILGQFTDCCSDPTNKTLLLSEVIHDKILSLNKPTVLNLMSGHDYPKLTIPIGARIRLDLPSKKLFVLEPVVR